MKILSIVIFIALIVAQLYAQETPKSTVQTPNETLTGNVARALFTNGVSDREPVDEVKNLTNDVNRIYFFTELKGLAGQTITHRWEYNGQVMFEISFDVGAPRWRVWSNKTLDPSWLGEWKVSVVDSEGKAITGSSFTYTKAGQ